MPPTHPHTFIHSQQMPLDTGEEIVAGVTGLLRREAALWGMTDESVSVTRPLFDSVFAPEAQLINPWYSAPRMHHTQSYCRLDSHTDTIHTHTQRQRDKQTV